MAWTLRACPWGGGQCRQAGSLFAVSLGDDRTPHGGRLGALSDKLHLMLLVLPWPSHRADLSLWGCLGQESCPPFTHPARLPGAFWDLEPGSPLPGKDRPGHGPCFPGWHMVPTLAGWASMGSLYPPGLAPAPQLCRASSVTSSNSLPLSGPRFLSLTMLGFPGCCLPPPSRDPGSHRLVFVPASFLTQVTSGVPGICPPPRLSPSP